MTSQPRVAVIVPTKQRPDYLRRCLASIRDAGGEDYPVFVVDQDPEHGAAGICADFGTDWVQYLPHAIGGKSAALNTGIAASESEFVAFTDDDCTVPEGWIERGLERFAAAERVGLVFGGAIPREHDTRAELVPSFVPGKFEVRRGGRAAAKIGGLGGNLFARRSVLEEVGGFDERLGPGTRFASAEDQDLNNRVLRAGHSVVAEPSLLVTHWGGRSYAGKDAANLLRGYSQGIGALAAKDIRRGNLAGAYPVVRELGAEARSALRHVSRREPGPYVARWPWLFAGTWRGLRTPVDKQTGRFLTPPRK